VKIVRVRFAVLAFAAFALPGLCAGAAGADPSTAAARSCGKIAFEPGTEFGVSDIRATRTSCSVARRIARRSKSHDIYETPRRYRALGFACRGRLNDDALPVVRWSCRRGKARVKFTRS
jgi:hypothetical protein